LRLELAISYKQEYYFLIFTMDIFQLNELTDDMMNLSDDDFYTFLENSLNKN
ncbi:unnamed protein product, partial [Rotaria sp. Silwood2]